MGKWQIYRKDGSKLTDASGKEVVTRTLEYTGEWMGACNISVDIESDSPIELKTGDYIDYRGERFEINYDPGKIKSAPRGVQGDGFKYNSVIFNGYADELVRSEFRDIVLNDNELHYTSLPKFVFYVSSLDDIADRLQANMDDQYGKGTWHFYTRNKKKSKGRGCDTATWEKVYGDGIADNEIAESTSLSISSQTCWDVLGLVNSKFDVNFVVRGRNVYIGTAGVDASHVFRYGKDNGLYEIEEATDSSQAVITRLRAYGNTTNMPVRYYAEMNKKCRAKISRILIKFAGDDPYFQMDIDLTYDKGLFIDKTDEGNYKIKIRIDNAEVYCEIRESSYEKNSTINCGSKGGNTAEAIRAFIEKIDEGVTLYITEGIRMSKVPDSNLEYTNNLPNNMAISTLMLPGFPNESLQAWWDRQDTQKKAWLNPTGKGIRFSEDKYRPYVESVNADEIGIRPASVFFDNDNDKEGLKDIFPTFEGMTVNGERIDVVDTGTEGVVTDNGVFKDGETVPDATIYLSSAIDFDLHALATDSFEVYMADGMCGGRSFKVDACAKDTDGRWKLRLQRAKDSSLELYFPYGDFPIRKDDHVKLIGIDMPSSYVEHASEELLRYAIAKLFDNDYTRKTYTPKVDEIFMARQHDRAEADKTRKEKSLYLTLKEGDIMHFEDSDLGIDKRVTINTLSIKEKDDKIPTYEVTLKEEKEVGTIQKIQNQISSIVSGSYGAGGFSRSQIENMVKNIADDLYLSKLNPDTARGVITFLRGLKINSSHKIDENGNATLGSLKIGDHGIDENGNAVLGKVVAELMSRFKGGAEFGEFIQGILYGTGGRVDERGNAEFESITSRSSIIAKELIVNRQQAVESDFMFTESGSVESVTEVPPATEGDNTTYELKLKKRWDNDFTAFHEQDCIRASINTLLEDGKYYDMWFRVLSVNTLTNTISVVMYPDNEVPSGKNYPPCELARLIRWGNPVDEKRQSCWYISSETGLLVWLDHVTKPIIDKTNYSVAIGKLPDALSFVFQDFPQADKRDGAFYAKWLAVQNIINVDYEGNVQQNVVDRGMWSLATAQGDKPYRATATEVHDVWRNGCKWRCISDKTTEEPKYASTGWAFLEGNPEFTCRITGADQTFDADAISTRDNNGNYPVFTTLSVRGYLYNEDVTDHILAKNVVWTRDTGNTNEDNIWAVSHASAGFSVPLTWEDLGKNAEERLSCSFKVEVAIIDETVNAQSGEEKTIKKAFDETEI